MGHRRTREQSKRVKLYTTPTCPWCVVAKHYLLDHGITFAEVDIMSDGRGRREMVVTTGQHGVPVIVVGEKAMIGWNEVEFARMLAG
jgi:glutaredoxin 3